MKLMKTVNDYEDYLRNEHRAETTVRAYTYAVRQYIRLNRSFSASALESEFFRICPGQA